MKAVAQLKLLPIVGIAVVCLGIVFLIISMMKTIALLGLLVLTVLIAGGIFMAARRFKR